MANVFLSANETFTAANNGLVIKGAAGGTEKLLIGSNVTGVTTDANIERIEVAGNLADYKFVIGASGIQITNAAGTVIATIPSLNQASTLAFADGSASLVQTGATTATLGGATLSTTTAAAVTVTTPLNTTDKSTVTAGSTGGTTTGQSFSLTTATETKTLTAGNDTVDGSTAVDSVSGDTIIDSSATDTDVANLVVSGSINPANMLNVETVNGTAKYGSISFDGSKFIGTKTFNFDSAIASGSATVTNNAATTITAGNNIATLSVTNGAAGATVAINAGSATNVTATGAAGADTMAVTLAAGTNTVAIDGNAGTDAYTINTKGGTLALTGTNTNNETLALNVSTGAQTVNVTTGLAKTTAVAGDQTVTIKGDEAVFDGQTMTNGLASGKTLNLVVTAASSASDLSKIAASTIELQALSTSATFANNANVKLGAVGLAGALTAASGATTLNVDLLNATTGALTNSGFTTVNVTANTVAVTALDARMGADATINLSGSKDVTAANTSTAKALDATNLTGKLVAEANATLLKVTGGSGADTLTVADAALAGTAVISAGTGNDTVIMKGTGTIALTAANAVTLDGGSAGTDTLQFTTAGSDFSASAGLKGSVVTGFEVIDTNGQAVVLTQKQLFTNGGNFRLDNTAGNGSFTVTDDGASSHVIDLGSMTFGVGVTTSPVIIGSTTQSNVLTGSAAADSITGGSAIDTIIGGAGVDTIVGGAANDVLTGGTGSDKFVIGNVTANGVDFITDFAAGGTDKIYASGNVAHTTAAAALTDKGSVDTAVYTTLDAYVATYAAAQTNATLALNAYKFVYGSDTYVLVDNGTAGYAAGTDALVKITGVVGTLVASDIINAA